MSNDPKSAVKAAVGTKAAPATKPGPGVKTPAVPKAAKITTAQDTILPDLGLKPEVQTSVVNVLKTVLADEVLLYTKLRNYHWNVTGPQFIALHVKFEEQYTAIEAVIDEVAERIRTYGYKAPGTLQEFKETARLQETPGEYPAARQMIANLVADHETMVRHLRGDVDQMDDLDDDAAQDFLTGLLQNHQTMAWMLRALIEDDAV